MSGQFGRLMSAKSGRLMLVQSGRLMSAVWQADVSNMTADVSVLEADVTTVKLLLSITPAAPTVQHDSGTAYSLVLHLPDTHRTCRV